MPTIEHSSNERNPSKLRFGIFCNSYLLKKWQLQTIEHLLNSGDAELVLLVNNAVSNQKESLLKKISSWVGKHFVYKLYQKFFYHPDSIKEIDLSSKFRNIPSIDCTVKMKGKYSEYFSDEDIASIRNYNLDFMLRFGFNIIRGEILNVPKYGVWSFHHDDETKYRGGPPGLWEIYFKDTINGAILQKLTDKLDSGIVLKKGYFKTVNHSYAANVDMLNYSCTVWPKQICTDIKIGVADYFNNVPSTSVAPVFKAPANLKMLSLLCKLFINKLQFHFNELFRSEQWNIGIIKLPMSSLINKEISDNKIIWMPKQMSSLYRADCFAFAEGNNVNILFERYDYKSRKAVINKTAYSESTGFAEEITVLQKPYHLSYPYVFSNKDEHYCIPEAFKNHKVDLYKIENNGNLLYHKTILENIDAVDSSLVFYNEKWWLFLTKNSNESNTNLYIYYSDEFNGKYLPHPANPVKTDVRSSRPAGNFFIENDILYRPAQDCSKTYGGRIVINKITKLNTIEFEEETTGFINPVKNSFYNNGVHTVNSIGDYTVIDAKRFTFVWAAFCFQLKRKVRKILRIHSNDK
ncbi:MAG: hypothetical protein ABR968_10875 [Bacteroidales bacterium]|jgi:hypothetical protein